MAVAAPVVVPLRRFFPSVWFSLLFSLSMSLRLLAIGPSQHTDSPFENRQSYPAHNRHYRAPQTGDLSHLRPLYMCRYVRLNVNGTPAGAEVPNRLSNLCNHPLQSQHRPSSVDPMPDPDVRLPVGAAIGIEVDVEEREAFREDVVAALREAHIRPLLPRSYGAGDAE